MVLETSLLLMSPRSSLDGCSTCILKLPTWLKKIDQELQPNRILHINAAKLTRWLINMHLKIAHLIEKNWSRVTTQSNFTHKKKSIESYNPTGSEIEVSIEQLSSHSLHEKGFQLTAQREETHKSCVQWMA
jgi:hypothetical protein